MTVAALFTLVTAEATSTTAANVTLFTAVTNVTSPQRDLFRADRVLDLQKFLAYYIH